MKKPNDRDPGAAFEGGEDPDSLDRFVYVRVQRLYDCADLKVQVPECSSEQHLLNGFSVDWHSGYCRVQHEIIVDTDEANPIHCDLAGFRLTSRLMVGRYLAVGEGRALEN